MLIYKDVDFQGFSEFWVVRVLMPFDGKAIIGRYAAKGKAGETVEISGSREELEGHAVVIVPEQPRPTMSGIVITGE